MRGRIAHLPHNPCFSSTTCRDNQVTNLLTTISARHSAVSDGGRFPITSPMPCDRFQSRLTSCWPITSALVVQPKTLFLTLPHYCVSWPKGGTVSGLAQLAAASAPRIEVGDRHREALSLIVGDTFADRVLFWNDRSLMPTYLERDFTTLIVSPQRLEDEQFFNALVSFIKARNSIKRSHANPRVDINSVSVSKHELVALTTVSIRPIAGIVTMSLDLQRSTTPFPARRRWSRLLAFQ